MKKITALICCVFASNVQAMEENLLAKNKARYFATAFALSTNEKRCSDFKKIATSEDQERFCIDIFQSKFCDSEYRQNMSDIDFILYQAITCSYFVKYIEKYGHKEEFELASCLWDSQLRWPCITLWNINIVCNSYKACNGYAEDVLKHYEKIKKEGLDKARERAKTDQTLVDTSEESLLEEYGKILLGWNVGDTMNLLRESIGIKESSYQMMQYATQDFFKEVNGYLNRIIIEKDTFTLTNPTEEDKNIIDSLCNTLQLPQSDKYSFSFKELKVLLSKKVDLAKGNKK